MTKAAEKASQKSNQDAVPVSNQAVNNNLVTPSLSIREPELIGQVGLNVKLSELSPHKLVIEQ